MAREKLLKLGCRESLVMFFDKIEDVAEIASRCGTSIFVIPKSQTVEIKNAIVLQPAEKTVITTDFSSRSCILPGYASGKPSR